ncbi:MAG: hypothetical protein H6977_11030 [Gammaproteobacteria bacterium]|nr:hypothetical protein [Gammaproteobacteria bacterium]MCP5200537.1 hypothetical protein [Gammaproteobacteria bacterium]
MSRKRPRPVLPQWLWLWFPPLLLLVMLPVRWLDPAAYRAWFDGEMGVVELATPVFALIGMVYGLRLLATLRRDGPSKLGLWVALLSAACFYLAGEELSWGQQLFHWHTPAAIDALNDQHETNLHNMSSWFDQKPRLLLELWVLIGGIIVPLRGLANPRRLSANVISSWFWPTLDCLPTAVLAIAIRLPERLKDVFGWESVPLEIRYSEPQEYYFALFLLLYLAALRRRVLLAQH